MSLSQAQKKAFRSIGHHLNPVVTVSENGVSENLLAELNRALTDHELIKVKVPTDDKEEKALIMDAIIRETESVKVQAIGHVLILFRPSEERKIQLPK